MSKYYSRLQASRILFGGEKKEERKKNWCSTGRQLKPALYWARMPSTDGMQPAPSTGAGAYPTCNRLGAIRPFLRPLLPVYQRFGAYEPTYQRFGAYEPTCREQRAFLSRRRAKRLLSSLFFFLFLSHRIQSAL